jgi:hypothetical protein
MQSRGAHLDSQNIAAEYKIRCERVPGEMLAEMPKHNGDSRLHDATRLSDLGVEKTQSHRWQAIARLQPLAVDARSVVE